MRLILVPVLALLLLGCDNHNTVTGQIKGMQVSDSQGTLLFHVVVEGAERRLILQGIDGQWIRSYLDAVQQSGGWITDLDLWLDSYHHTYANGDVAWDSMHIFTSTPKDSGNAPRIVPGFDGSTSQLLPLRARWRVSIPTTRRLDSRAGYHRWLWQVPFYHVNWQPRRQDSHTSLLREICNA
jgi:hypothetical protein